MEMEIVCKPLVSVVIPTYKRPWSYLERAVRSVLNQSYSNLEIIVIDDSPESFELRSSIKENMEKLSSQDSRISFLRNEKNMGGSLARNRGIASSKGEYITFLDDDDEYLPDKVRHQVQFMQENNCDLSFENMIMYNDKGAIVDVRNYSDLDSFENEELLKYHLMKHMTGTPTFMFKTTKLKEINGFEDAKMGQEFYLMLKAIEAGLIIRYYDICDVKIYKHSEGGITQGKNKINGENNLYNFKKGYFDRLSKRQKMFIRFRHYAVMVVAYLRNKMYLKAIIAAVASFVVSPIDFCQQVLGFIKRVIIQRKSKEYQ